MKKLTVLLIMLSLCVSSEMSAQSRKEKKAAQKATANATAQSRGTQLIREECEELAMDITAVNPRAVGNGISMNESMATNLALLDARAQLAQSLEMMVKGGMSNYMGQVGVNGKDCFKNTQKMEQEGYFDAILRNTRPIKKNTYLKDDGSFNVYVCIEMTPEWSNSIISKLREDEIMGVEVDEAMFLERLKATREEFLQRRAKE